MDAPAKFIARITIYSTYKNLFARYCADYIGLSVNFFKRIRPNNCYFVIIFVRFEFL